VIETAPRWATPPVTPPLTTSRGAALYIGALLGPGLLLLPGLAVTVAGPASLLAWVALLVLSALFAVVFAAFGLRFPSAGGVIGYVTAGLGARAGLAAGWCFLAGVVAGAPVVCLIGASYVTELTGGGPAPPPRCCWWASSSAWWRSRSRGRRDRFARPTGRRSPRTAGWRSRTRPRS
jgi:amino acid transporter